MQQYFTRHSRNAARLKFFAFTLKVRREWLGLLNVLGGERFPRQVSDRILRGVGSGVEAELTSRQAQSGRSLPARNRNCEAIAVLNKRNPAALISLLHPASVAITAHGYHAPCELIVAALGGASGGDCQGLCRRSRVSHAVSAPLP